MPEVKKVKVVKAGFGGFLIVPLIGFILTPAKFLFVLYTCLFTPGALSIPLNRTILILDSLSVCVMLVTFFLFIQKKRTAPGLYVCHRLLWILAATAIFVASSSYALTPASNLELAGDYFGSVIGAMIFVPYFLLSRRVQATFINGPAAGNAWDAIVKPIAPFLEGFSSFLRKTKLFVILIILGYALLVTGLCIVGNALF